MFFFLTIFLLLNTCLVQEQKQSSPNIPNEPKVLHLMSSCYPPAGAECYLGTDGMYLERCKTEDEVTVCAGFSSLHEWIKFTLAGEKKGIEDLMANRRIARVPNGTKVKVIKNDTTYVNEANRDYKYTEVRVLEGKQKDLLLLVATTRLVSIKEVLSEKEKQRRIDEKKMQEIQAKKAKQEEDAKKEAAKDEDRAAELLKAAKRWLSEGDKELALRRLDELLKRFPKAAVAEEAKKLKDEIAKKK